MMATSAHDLPWFSDPGFDIMGYPLRRLPAELNLRCPACNEESETEGVCQSCRESAPEDWVSPESYERMRAMVEEEARNGN